MDISIILMGIGIFFIIISFFFKDKTTQLEKEIEELSINIYQETNGLKRRLKVVEEELLVDHNFKVKSPPNVVKQPTPRVKRDPMETFQQVAAQVKASQTRQNYTQTQQPTYVPPQSPPVSGNKPIHSILINQVIELNKQGLAIDEISKLSTLSPQQVQSILAGNGGQ